MINTKKANSSSSQAFIWTNIMQTALKQTVETKIIISVESLEASIKILYNLNPGLFSNF